MSLNQIALIGNPNSGKSSLFNALTGLNQRIGNFPGVTVERKHGKLELPDGTDLTIVDYPGLYSIYPHGKDEKIVADILCDAAHPSHPQKIVYVLDAMQMERQLLLLTQLIDMGFSILVALNMIDIAQAESMEIDSKMLSKKLGVPVVEISARTGKNLELLKSKIQNWDGQVSQVEIYKKLEKKQIEDLDFQVADTMGRFNNFEPWMKSIIQRKQIGRVDKLTEQIDRIICHNVWGPIIFFLIMLFVFQALFSWSSIPMDWIDGLFGSLGDSVKQSLGDTMLSSLIADGVIAGIGGVVIFIPQIFFLFLFLSILEEIGYMSRAAYMFDGLLQRFGLNGRSIVALVSSSACAIPAIMSTRTIESWKERIITIMIAPLISCSARIPVYVILVGFVISDQARFGIFNAQGIVFMGLYLISIVAALITGWGFKKIIKSESSSFFVMELPKYKRPIWRNIWLTLKEKVWAFIWDAGRVIFFISIILWFLASFGPPSKMQAAEQAVVQLSQEQSMSAEELDDLLASKKIEASFAGHMGKFIEPVIKPLGYDWKIGIALISSFAAREVFVGSMATIYAVGSKTEEDGIRETMAKQKNANTGLSTFTPAVALSLLMFYLFAMQCMSTLAVTKRETNSWKWPIIQFVFMTALAYIAAFVVYQLMK